TLPRTRFAGSLPRTADRPVCVPDTGTAAHRVEPVGTVGADRRRMADPPFLWSAREKWGTRATAPTECTDISRTGAMPDYERGNIDSRHGLRGPGPTGVAQRHISGARTLAAVMLIGFLSPHRTVP